MSELLSEFENKIYLSDKDIFTKIWTSPRLVFKYINDNQYKKFMVLLLMLSGLTNAIERSIGKFAGSSAYVMGSLTGNIIAGALLGWIFYYLLSALLRLSGKWLKGQGDINSILNMLAHASIPKILAIVLMLPQIAVYGTNLFMAEEINENANVSKLIIVFGIGLVQVGLGLWSIVLSIIGLSEVHKFSIGKSVLNFLFAFLILVIPIVMLVVMQRQ